MKKYIIAISSLFLFTSFIAKQNDNKKLFEELYALEGKWIMKTSKGFIGEEWHKIDESYLQNRGFFIKAGDTITTERIALRNRNDGVFYTSTVVGENNGQAIDFKLTSSDEKNKIFVFENPEHDFPKRIVYEIISADSLHARIDGGKNDPMKRSDFYYNKVK